MKHKDKYSHYPRLENLHAVMPSLLQLFYENKEALRFQDMMFGGETVLYTSLFYERGSAQDIHRDTPYFSTRPEYRYFGMWVALEDVDESNGPLMAVPCGNLLPELDREAIARRHYEDLDNLPPDSELLWSSYQRDVGDQCAANGLKLTPIPVKRGSTIIWHPHLPHGGSPITDISRTRFSLVMHTTPIGTPVYHQNAFFNPQKYFPTEPKFDYKSSGGRSYVEQNVMSFGHSSYYSADDFVGPDGRDLRPLSRRVSSLAQKVRRALSWAQATLEPVALSMSNARPSMSSASSRLSDRCLQSFIVSQSSRSRGFAPNHLEDDSFYKREQWPIRRNTRKLDSLVMIYFGVRPVLFLWG